MTGSASIRVQPWDTVMVAGAVALLVAAVVYADTLGQLGRVVAQADPLRLVLAAGAYLFSHVIRILRLCVIFGPTIESMRKIGRVHVAAASVSLFLPLKLGEVFRIIGLGMEIRSYGRALIAVWIERAFDASLIVICILAAIITFPATAPVLLPALLFCLAFLAATFVLFFAVPENISDLKLYIIRRFDSPRSVPVLGAFDMLQSLLAEAPRMLANRKATIGVLTLGIWALEAVAVLIAVPVARELVPASLAIPLMLISNIMAVPANPLDVFVEPFRQMAAIGGHALPEASANIYQAIVIFSLPAAFVAMLIIGRYRHERG